MNRQDAELLELRRQIAFLRNEYGDLLKTVETLVGVVDDQIQAQRAFVQAVTDLIQASRPETVQ